MRHKSTSLLAAKASAVPLHLDTLVYNLLILVLAVGCAKQEDVCSAQPGPYSLKISTSRQFLAAQYLSFVPTSPTLPPPAHIYLARTLTWLPPLHLTRGWATYTPIVTEIGLSMRPRCVFCFLCGTICTPGEILDILLISAQNLSFQTPATSLNAPPSPSPIFTLIYIAAVELDDVLSRLPPIPHPRALPLTSTSLHRHVSFAPRWTSPSSSSTSHCIGNSLDTSFQGPPASLDLPPPLCIIRSSLDVANVELDDTLHQCQPSLPFKSVPAPSTSLHHLASLARRSLSPSLRSTPHRLDMTVDLSF
ncbi:hypothetical protein C8F01DRAFT_1376726 [Mycena amicta]|nr:hypothetical protein C8F01DRAFT_1376726 [Mycena amicta]